MSTVDNLIELKDQAVDLAHAVVGQLGRFADQPNWNDNLEPFEISQLESDVRALVTSAKLVIEEQAAADKANEEELSQTGTHADFVSAFGFGARPGDPTPFEDLVWNTALLWMNANPEKEAVQASDIERLIEGRGPNVIGSALQRLHVKGHVKRFVSSNEATYWQPLQKGHNVI